MKNYQKLDLRKLFLAVMLLTGIFALANCRNDQPNLTTLKNNKGSVTPASLPKTSIHSLSGTIDVCPVTPVPSQEAKDLLKYLYSLQDSVKMLAGQHNFVQTPATYTNQAITNTGKTPAIWGSDFSYGTGLDGPTGFRQKMINQAITQWSAGSIIVLTYHQVRPDSSDAAGFSSVKTTMTTAEFDSVLTPGTSLNNAWKAKWDIIAGYLQQLKAAHVPVIFRPYHEMNGGSFWWGKKARYPELYQMTFNYLVTTKRLDNILFMWNANRINTYAVPATPYYPGNNYVDILATDVYYRDFNTATYNEMVTLAGTKPIALGEVGVPPSATVLSSQPKYIWAMEWARPTDYTTWAVITTFYNLSKVYTQDEVVHPFATSSCPN